MAAISVTAAFFLVMTAFGIRADHIISACNRQWSAVNQHLCQLLPRIIIYRLHSSSGNAHLLSAHFLCIIQSVNQTYRFVFIYCHFYFFRSCSRHRSESAALRHGTDFAAFLRSWHFSSVLSGFPRFKFLTYVIIIPVFFKIINRHRKTDATRLPDLWAIYDVVSYFCLQTIY